jgi:hypothetical protein
MGNLKIYIYFMKGAISMKKPLINVTKQVLDEGVSKKLGKKILITTIISDALIVGLYGGYLRWCKKQEEKENAENE